MIGDIRELSDGCMEEVIHEAMIDYGSIETDEQRAARVKKGRPEPAPLRFMVVGTKIIKKAAPGRLH